MHIAHSRPEIRAHYQKQVAAQWFYIITKFSTFICCLVFALNDRGKEQEIFFKDLSRLVVVSV